MFTDSGETTHALNILARATTSMTVSLSPLVVRVTVEEPGELSCVETSEGHHHRIAWEE